MLTATQLPYTGPYYGPSHAKGPMKGPTAEALKRTWGRLGYIDWADFDNHYNLKCEFGAKEFQRMGGIRPITGQYGKETWELLRKATIIKDNKVQYAVDAYSRKLIQDEAHIVTESDKHAAVQKYIAEWWTIAIAHQGAWHYNDEYRPGHFPADPARGGICDCSLAVVYAHHYAKEKTGYNVPDPAKQNWTGYGNTDWYEDDWPHIGSPFRIGDLAHFHSSRHVIECIKPGDFNTAQWGSNGRENAPELVKSLSSYYRFPSEYMFTVRPDLLVS